MAQLAEQVGFDSLWLGDHLIYREPDEPATGPWEAWSTMAAIAAVTSSVKLGPLVASTSFHSPAMLAKKAAAIDEISNGRFILGLGAGWNETEYRAFGFAYDRRVSRFEEAFTIIRRLLAGECLDFDGKYYSVEACELLPKSLRAGGPPLMVGSNGPRMLRITLPHVQIWNAWYAWYGNRLEGLRRELEGIDEAAVAVGRNPRDIARTTALLLQLPGGKGRAHGDEERGGSPPYKGSPEEIAGVLSQYAEAGIAQVQLVLDPINLDSIEWCGRMLQVLDA